MKSLKVVLQKRELVCVSLTKKNGDNTNHTRHLLTQPDSTQLNPTQPNSTQLNPNQTRPEQTVPDPTGNNFCSDVTINLIGGFLWQNLPISLFKCSAHEKLPKLYDKILENNIQEL